MTTPSSGRGSETIGPITLGTDPVRPRATSRHNRARTASLLSSDSDGAPLLDPDAAALNARAHLDGIRLHRARAMPVAVAARICAAIHCYRALDYGT